DRAATTRAVLFLRRGTSPDHQEGHAWPPSHTPLGRHRFSYDVTALYQTCRLSTTLYYSSSNPRSCITCYISAITPHGVGLQKHQKPHHRAVARYWSRATAYPTMREHSNESKTHRPCGYCGQRPGGRCGDLSAQLWSRAGQRR